MLPAEVAQAVKRIQFITGRHVSDVMAGAYLALMMLEGKLPRAADDLHVVVGTVCAYGVEKCAKTRIYQRPWIGRGISRWIRLRRRCTRGRHA